MRDTNGMITINESISDPFIGKQDTILKTTQPTSYTISGVVRSILDIAEEAVQVVIDVGRRKVVGATGDGANTSLVTGVTPNTKRCTLTPVPGQSGRSLAFSAEYDEGFPLAEKAVIDAMLAPVAPTFTAESLAQKLMASVPDDSLDPFITIDQGDGKIYYRSVTNDVVRSTLEGHTDSLAGGGVEVNMSEPAVNQATQLPFEGGAV
jgi:hypothetical protein